MASSSRYVVAGIVLVAGVAIPCTAQDIASDFQQALAGVPSPTTDPPVMMFEDANPAAAGIASEYRDPASVEFLKTQARTRDTGKTAILVLAKQAATNATARDALSLGGFLLDGRGMVW